MAQKMQKIKVQVSHPTRFLTEIKFLSYKPLNMSIKIVSINLMFFTLFHRSKGRVCLGSYMGVVAIHTKTPDVQLHSSPSKSFAAGTPQLFLTLGQNS